MEKKLMLMLAAMLLAVFTISCSKSSDEPEPGGVITPDPVTPSEIKYELNANAVLIPKEVCQNLVSVDTLGHRWSCLNRPESPRWGNASSSARQPTNCHTAFWLWSRM